MIHESQTTTTSTNSASKTFGSCSPLDCFPFTKWHYSNETEQHLQIWYQNIPDRNNQTIQPITSICTGLRDHEVT